MELTEQLALGGLVLVLLTGVALLLRQRGTPFLLKRHGPNKAGRQGRVTQRIPLTPQHCLHVIEVGHARWLVATHPGGVAMQSLPQSFEEVLEKMPEVAAN